MYEIDRDGREFVLFTNALADEARYGGWKRIVDRAAEALRFD